MARRLDFRMEDELEVNQEGYDSVEFGFVPAHLLAELDASQDYRTRMHAMEQVHKLLLDTQESLLLPHLASFVKFLGHLLNDKNFTILLTTLQVFGDLVKKVTRHINPHLRYILPRLISKFGDNKIVIRQMNMKLFNVLLQTLTPAPIMNMLMSSTPHENWHVRKQVVNCITVSLLSYPKYGFEYMRLVRTLGCVLNDPKSKVRNGSFDALAVVHRNIGDRLFDLVEEINEEEEAVNGVLLITQTQLSMLRKRLTEGYMLPVAREDGSIESSYAYEDELNFDDGMNNIPPMSRHPSNSSSSSKRIPFPISVPVDAQQRTGEFTSFDSGRVTPSRHRDRKSNSYSQNWSAPLSAPIRKESNMFSNDTEGSDMHRTFPDPDIAANESKFPTFSEGSATSSFHINQSPSPSLIKGDQSPRISNNHWSERRSQSPSLSPQADMRPDSRTGSKKKNVSFSVAPHQPVTKYDSVSSEYDEQAYYHSQDSPDAYTSDKLQLWLAMDDAHGTPRKRDMNTSSVGQYSARDNESQNYNHSRNMNRLPMSQARPYMNGDDMDRPVTERAHIASKLKSLKSKRPSESTNGPTRALSAHTGGRRSANVTTYNNPESTGSSTSRQPVRHSPPPLEADASKYSGPLQTPKSRQYAHAHSARRPTTYRRSRTEIDDEVTFDSGSDDDGIEARYERQYSSAQDNNSNQSETIGEWRRNERRPLSYGNVDERKPKSYANIEERMPNAYGNVDERKPKSYASVDERRSISYGNIEERMPNAYGNVDERRPVSYGNVNVDERKPKSYEYNHDRTDSLDDEVTDIRNDIPSFAAEEENNFRHSVTTSRSTARAEKLRAEKLRAAKIKADQMKIAKMKRESESAAQMEKSEEDPFEKGQRNTPVVDEELFVPSAELTSVSNPSLELKQSISRLKSKEWKERFIALTSIRRLALHHPATLYTKIQLFVKELKVEVDSLRSSIVKNATTCCIDLFENIGRNMDNEAAILTPALLKRASESNAFLAKEASKALVAMITNCTSSKVLTILLSFGGSGNKDSIRSTTAEFLDKFIEHVGEGIVSSRDFNTLLRCVGSFVVGNSSHMRDYGKQSVAKLSHFMGNFEFENVAKRNLPSAQFTVIKKVLDRGIGIGFVPPSTASGFRPRSTLTPHRMSSSRKSDGRLSKSNYDGSISVRGHSTNSSHNNLYSRPSSMDDITSDSSNTYENLPSRTPSGRRSRSRKTISEDDEAKIVKICADLGDSDWKIRKESLDAVAKFCEQNLSAASEKSLIIYQSLAERLNDNNKKVSMHALRIVKRVIPLLSDTTESSLNILLPALASNLAAANAAIQAVTIDCLNLLEDTMDVKTLCPAYCNAAIFGNPRSKVVMLEKIGNVVGKVYGESSRIVTKHVVPLSFQLLGEIKLDIRNANEALILKLYHIMGDNLFDISLTNRLSPTSLRKLKQITNTR